MKKIITLLLISIFAFSSCSLSSKPSKDDVINGMNKKIEKAAKDADASDKELKDAKKYIKCAIDKSYDKLSTKTLEAMADDKLKASRVDSKISKKDNGILEKNSAKC